MEGTYIQPRDPKKRQFLVDVSVTARRDVQTGVQRVVRGVLRHLLLVPPHGFEVIPVRAGRWLGYRYGASYSRKLAPQGNATGLRGKVRASAGDIFLALDLTPSILPRHSEQLRTWVRAGVKIFFFVHDLLPVMHPAWFTKRGVANFARWVHCLGAFANGAICASRATADDLRRWVEENQPGRNIPIATVSLGADVEESAPSTGLPRDFEQLVAAMRSRPVVLMVGTIEPRKGHSLALSAFELLWQQGSPATLLIVGRVGWNVDVLVRRIRQHPELGKRLLWLKGVSDEALCRLYAGADGVLLASEAEGFGLPLVEAAYYGKPVLARDIPVYREVAENHAILFRGDDAQSLASDLSRWLQAIKHGVLPPPLRMRIGTWSECARTISDITLGWKSR
jgi:glycosyltransferase involved in cell wall biosynthesis